MLIIGHRGAAGLAPENTLASIRAGIQAGVDILELDIYMTRDRVTVLLDDNILQKTHELQAPVRTFSFEQLKSLHADSSPIKLETILDRYFGAILINLELKSIGSGKVVTELLKNRLDAKPFLWDNIILSSHKPTELIDARQSSKYANLALLHELNSFAYLRYHRSLQFTAIGFHRLHINKLALEIAKKAGIFTYAYTVNRPEAAKRLEELGIDGVVTDRPDILIKEFAKN